MISSLAEDAHDEDTEAVETAKVRSVCALDPGWMLAEVSGSGRAGMLERIAERPWWPRSLSTGPESEIVGRLWRHSVAVSIAARGLAREGGDPDPEAMAAAGLLCGLGHWAVAAVAPEWLRDWWSLEDPRRRREKAQHELGMDLTDLGRRLAERWDCDPLVVDAAWLHADHGGKLNPAATSPDRMTILQEAYHWAEQTPWSLGRRDHEPAPSEPRLRILMAEVQARCAGSFVDAGATPYEERMTQQNARLQRQLAAFREAQEQGDRLLQLLAEADPTETPEEWADRAARAWCGESRVSAARVVWRDDDGHGPAASLAEGPEPTRNRTEAPSGVPRVPSRPPTVVMPLAAAGRERAVIELWCSADRTAADLQQAMATGRRAWESWAALLAGRARLERRLEAVASSFRRQVESEEERLRQGKLSALGEFAAGAGHELNNPLAVIVGRAQLLLARVKDAEVARSLRIILNQAQRAHRILRDLMFVARPPAPRCRPCRPSELLVSLLRDFERDCSARGVRLVSEIDESMPALWGDPDALRHLGEILLRNALQATPPDGRILVKSSRKDNDLIWSFSDTGKGIGPREGAHLFDPFFCGRQAGRGLGLGLPRAARIVDAAGGRLRWSSIPGLETTFQVQLPLAAPPDPTGPAASPRTSLAPHANDLLKG